MSTSTGTYSSDYYESILTEGRDILPLRCYSEKDLAAVFEKIIMGLKNENDWQIRISSLELLHSITRGVAGTPLLDTFIQHLRQCHELVEMQALDLRSVVSKEACRAIAVIGQVLGVQFQAFGDIWLPKLLRQAALKVQVVNVAADKCIRICIAASRSIVGGYPRLLALFLDQLTTSKVPVVRRFTLEYACLACAIWPVESLDKHMILFRTMITAGATDADPLARRAARQLYWILREKSTGLFTAPMEALLQDLEISTQKHMNAEIQQPNADLLLLLRLASGGTFDPSKYTATTIVRTSVPSVSAPVNTATVINNPRPARSISSPRGGQSMQYTTANSISDSVATNTLTMNDNSIEPLEPRLLSGPLGDVSRSLVNRRLSIASGPVRITPKPVNLSTQDKVTVPLPVTTPVGISNSAEINYLVPNAQVVSNINASAASLLKTGPLVKKLVDNNDDGELARSTKLLNVDKENRADFVNIGRSNTNLIVGAALLGAATTRRILSDTSNNSVNKPESFMHTSVSEQKLVPVTDLGRIVESQSDVHKPSLAPPTRVAQRRQSLSVEVSNNTEVESHGNVPVSPWNQIPALPRLSVNISEPPAKSFLFEKPSRVLPSVKSVVPTPANTAPVVTPLSTPRKPSFSTGPANRPPGSQSKLHSTDGCSAPSSATQSVRKAPLDTSHRTSALNLSTASSAAHSNSVGSTPAKGIPVGSSLSTQTGIDAVRSLAEDTFWTTRLQAFEWLNSQLREIACISEVSETRVNLLISTSERVTVDFCLDLAVSHLSDTHHKVALESFVTLDLCIGHFASAMEGKIGQFLLSLFARLSDRRQLVKDAAAVTLEKLKQSFSPELQVTALAPKLHEVSERTKAVVFSFMATLVPACADYFAQSQATFAFLNRLSCILSAGSGGAKPPTAVMLAGQKLLEAVYQVAPTVVCSQLAASPMQSQAVLKRLLERCAPTIDTLVQTAGRFDSLARQLTARPIAINRDNTVEVLDAPLIVPNILTKDNSPVISQSHAELIQIPVQIPIDVGVNVSPTIASPVTSKSSTSVNINTSSASKPQSMLTNQSARNTPDIKSDSKTRSQLTPVIPTTPVPRVSPQTVSTPLMAHGLLDPLQVLAGLQQGASRQLMERATHTLQTLAITGDTTFWLQYSEQVVRVLLQSFTMIKSSCISSNTIGGTDSPVSISSSRAQVMTGFSPLLTSTSKELSSPSSSATTDSVTSMECLHNCSRLLAMLAQYRLINLMSFFNELIGVLVSAVDFVPLSVALQCEQTLSELSQHNALCAIDLLLPYLPSNKNMPSGGGKESSSPQLVLFALNIITSTLKHVSNTQLQNILPMLLPPSVSLLCGQVVELRQGAVFLMVQLYSIAGESVLRHSALDSLSPSQRSLLTVYINRQQKNI